MRKFMLLAASAALLAMPATAATIVNLDGQANASTDASTAVTVNLDAGRYSITFIQDEYTAFSRWTKNSGCDSMGELCRQGWENSAIMIIDDGVFHLGHAGGGYGPKPEDSLYYADANQSLASLAGYSYKFTLSEASDVSFFIHDNILKDNRGGVSLSIDAIPEPATWGMLIAGFGLVGSTMRRRRQSAVVAN